MRAQSDDQRSVWECEARSFGTDQAERKEFWSGVEQNDRNQWRRYCDEVSINIDLELNQAKAAAPARSNPSIPNPARSASLPHFVSRGLPRFPARLFPSANGPKKFPGPHAHDSNREGFIAQAQREAWGLAGGGYAEAELRSSPAFR